MIAEWKLTRKHVKINACSAVTQAEFLHLPHCKMINRNAHLPTKWNWHFFLLLVSVCVPSLEDWQGKQEDSKCLLQYFIVFQELWDGYHITNWLYEQLMFWNLPLRASNFKCKAQLTQELILSYLSLENWISQTFK